MAPGPMRELGPGKAILKAGGLEIIQAGMHIISGRR